MVRTLAALLFVVLLLSDLHQERREAMVRVQIEERGITDTATLRAMRTVPRHLFVPPSWIDEAYDDRPLPIGYGQTISQPYIVAYMTELVKPKRAQRVLEIGTGSGYQAAVLAQIVDSVFTIEIVTALAKWMWNGSNLMPISSSSSVATTIGTLATIAAQRLPSIRW